jgi:YHS domain-containing protein
MKTVTKDPVCGMEVKDSKIQSTNGDTKYNFCSNECKAEFEKNPKKYSA